MTSEVDVVVMGAGLAGLSVALSLATAGKSVTLLDNQVDPIKTFREPRLAWQTAASFKNAGMLDLYLDAPGAARASHLDQFCRGTREIYESLGPNLVRPGGCLIVAKDQTEADDYRAVFPEASPPSRSDAPRRVRGVPADHDGRSQVATPEIILPKLIQRVRDAGATILYEQNVFKVTQSQRGFEILSRDGARERLTRARDVVVAAGPGTSSALRELIGVKLPIINILGAIAEFQLDEATLASSEWPRFSGCILGARSHADWGRRARSGDWLYSTRRLSEDSAAPASTTHLYMSCHGDNRVFIGGPRIELGQQYQQADLAGPRYLADLADTLRYARALVDLGTEAPPINTWSGVMAFPCMKSALDELPIVGPLDGVYDGRPKVYVCSGFASGGFGVAPGAGRWLAERMLNPQAATHEDVADLAPPHRGLTKISKI